MKDQTVVFAKENPFLALLVKHIGEIASGQVDNVFRPSD